MEDTSRQIKKLDLKQNAIKILINSIYGAFGNKWFYFYDPDIAQSITLQGQDLIKFSIRAVNHYFTEKWHLDKELHELLGLTKYQIEKISIDSAIYTDTDSVAGDSKIRSKKYGEISIEEWYRLSESNGNAGSTLAGHESVKTSSDDAILNFHDDSLVHHEVRRIIRHKVSKERWKITTESGKSVIVTGDHSVIVFRDDVQVEVKASQIKDGDIVLVVE